MSSGFIPIKQSACSHPTLKQFPSTEVAPDVPAALIAQEYFQEPLILSVSWEKKHDVSPACVSTA